jgi:hypothetical protein
MSRIFKIVTPRNRGGWARTLTPDPGFDYYYKACRKGDKEAKAVAVSYSPMGVLADASEINFRKATNNPFVSEGMMP